MIDQSVQKRLKFIEDYKKASNAASGSKYDSNANVTTKNIATLSAELPKGDFINLNRAITEKYLLELYGQEMIDCFRQDLDHHIIYSHDESSIYPYCVAVSLYPYLLEGLKPLGGTSGAPKHAESFIGGLTNLIFLISGQFAGAVAVPETLSYLDHFLRLDYGNDYTQHLDDVLESWGNRQLTLRKKIEDLFQEYVYCINQPAAARGYQSPFVNQAYFDKGYFDAIFKDFFFPDGDQPCWETTKELQKMFMKWFNKERTHEILTFPVETMNLLYTKDTKEYVDEEMADFTAEMWAEGHSFFLYNSDSADALSSCCRLKSGIEENVFSYTLGAGGIQTGSKKVITLNLNRIVQDWDKSGRKESFGDYIKVIVRRVHKYLIAWNTYLEDMFNSNLLSVYKAGYISLEKQYLTCGVNAGLEAAEYLGISPTADNIEYQRFMDEILTAIKQVNLEDKTRTIKFNTEFTPCENASAKFYKWDKEDGYKVPSSRILYNSYFYAVEDESVSVLDKIKLHGNSFIKNLDGGSAAHINLDSFLSKKQYRQIMDAAAQEGCSYYTFNIPSTICNECGHITKENIDHCPKCNSENVDKATRIIGYLKRVSNFSTIRQQEAAMRHYSTSDEIGRKK